MNPQCIFFFIVGAFTGLGVGISTCWKIFSVVLFSNIPICQHYRQQIIDLWKAKGFFHENEGDLL